MFKILKDLTPLLLFLGFIGFLAYGLSRDPAKLESILIDQPFPDFALADLHNPDVILTDAALKDNINLVNVFGSWCVACVQEHPNLVAIGQMDRVRIVGMNWRDEREKAKAWLTKYGDPYDVIIFDADSQLAIDLGVTGAPETFVVDRNGRIRYKHVGIITAEVWRETLVPMIETLERETSE